MTRQFRKGLQLNMDQPVESNVQKTNINGLVVVNRPQFPDDRGFFKETFRLNELEEVTGQPFNIVQENHSRSTKNTLRGVHIAPWNKLIYVVRGTVQIVIVDCRPDSPTFGQVYYDVIGEDKRAKIFIPKGCGNSYLVMSDEADYVYLTDAYWAAGLEKGVAWDDQDLNIKWQLNGQQPLLSEKDKINPRFHDLFPVEQK